MLLGKKKKSEMNDWEWLTTERKRNSEEIERKKPGSVHPIDKLRVFIKTPGPLYFHHTKFHFEAVKKRRKDKFKN